MKTEQKLISQKPTELDVSLKYSCPNCKLDHWLFLREAQTKNYKIVCECGTVFRPKRVAKLQIVYHKHPPKLKTQELPFDTMDKCVKILVGYGFDSKESKKILELAYKQTSVVDIPSLVKKAIQLFGEN